MYLRLKARAKAEQESNKEETDKFQGKQIYYGQVVQLLHYSTNTYLTAFKTKRAEMDAVALKIGFTKDPSATCYWKIMPQFKVRYEGEKVRVGDAIVLVHLKSNLVMSISDYMYPNTTSYEVNLSGTQTGWQVEHYSPYLADQRACLLGSDVIRIFHQDKGLKKKEKKKKKYLTLSKQFRCIFEK